MMNILTRNFRKRRIGRDGLLPLKEARNDGESLKMTMIWPSKGTSAERLVNLHSATCMFAY